MQRYAHSSIGAVALRLALTTRRAGLAYPADGRNLCHLRRISEAVSSCTTKTMRRIKLLTWTKNGFLQAGAHSAAEKPLKPPRVLTASQRRFNDQITGHSGLTFFEAFESEVGFFTIFVLRL